MSSFVDSISGLIDGAFDALSAPIKFIAGEEAFGAKANVEQNGDSSVTVNGVVVPKLVAEQLKNAGIAIAFLSAGQLEAAIQACAVDCKLIDDPNGTNFFDDLELDAADLEPEHTKEEEQSLEEDELNRRAFVKPGQGNVFAELSEVNGSMYASAGGFRQKIKEEREQQRERRKRGSSKEEDSAEKPSMSHSA